MYSRFLQKPIANTSTMLSKAAPLQLYTLLWAHYGKTKDAPKSLSGGYLEAFSVTGAWPVKLSAQP
jgi:hypothetical protein